MKQRKKARYSCEDVFSILCIVVGISLLGGSIIDFLIRKQNPQIQKYVVDLPVTVAATFCLFHAVPCWRHSLSFGYIYGCSTILLGLAAGYSTVYVWNEGSKSYVEKQYQDSGVQFFRTEFVNILDFKSVLLLTMSGLCICVIALIDAVIMHFRLRYYLNLCSNVVLFIEAGLSIICCTAMAFFLKWPKVESHVWIFDKLVEYPVDIGHQRWLMFGLMCAAAVVCWLVLLPRPHRIGGSFFRTILIVLVLISHASMIILGIIDVKLPDSWELYPQPIIWFMFGLSTFLLLVTLLFHSCTGPILPKTKSFDADGYLNASDKNHFYLSQIPSVKPHLSTHSTTSSLAPYPLPPPQPHASPEITYPYVPTYYSTSQPTINNNHIHPSLLVPYAAMYPRVPPTQVVVSMPQKRFN